MFDFLYLCLAVPVFGALVLTPFPILIKQTLEYVANQTLQVYLQILKPV